MEKFFTGQAKRSQPSSSAQSDSSPERDEGDAPVPPKAVPKGVVLGKDGKPCRSCTSFADWRAMTKSQLPSTSPTSSVATSSSSTLSSAAASSNPSTPPADCPPDISELGNHSWTLLHTISASYPPVASPQQQTEMRQFLSLFAKLYPCWVCADDFREWMARKGNEPRVGGREGLGRWMCEAHNEVNRKTGKREFDCSKWEERWRTGGEGCG